MTHGNRQREQGTAFERRVADFAASHDLPWDRAPLTGRKDRGDLTGTLAYGVVVEIKSKAPGKPIRLNDAMVQAEAAVQRVPFRYGHVVPAVITQRAGYMMADQFVTMRLSDWLDWVAERDAARAGKPAAS